jgi:esterase/lipase superfamily enzyme
MSQPMMITNRAIQGNDLGIARDRLRCFIGKKPSPQSLRDWTEVTPEDFRRTLIGIAGGFPALEECDNEKQRHISFFIHGYNNDWKAAVRRYTQLRSDLFSGRNSLGQLILFTWPSDGSTFGYLPDREDARASGPDLAGVFVDLHDHLKTMQRATAARHGEAPCRAKISVIAHSMGNYVLQKALAVASRQLNNPQLITLVHQVAMVAADVDNDLFQRGQPSDADGSLMANLCYRIGALFTGRDQVLGASAGLKHFGTRRLGRSGLANQNDVHDNVFDFDVTRLIPGKAGNIHSAVFEHEATRNLLRQILIGRDRGLLVADPAGASE